jgi:hypothetical protein
MTIKVPNFPLWIYRIFTGKVKPMTISETFRDFTLLRQSVLNTINTKYNLIGVEALEHVQAGDKSLMFRLYDDFFLVKTEYNPIKKYSDFETYRIINQDKEFESDNLDRIDLLRGKFFVFPGREDKMVVAFEAQSIRHYDNNEEQLNQFITKYDFFLNEYLKEKYK